jgi:cysteine-rich repeat protein
MVKRGLTPFLKNFLLILGLLFGMVLIVLIIYNVSQTSTINLSDINVKIDKETVKLDADNLFLSLNAKQGKEIIEQIKFVLYDGTTPKEVILNASELKKTGIQSYNILFKHLGILTVKTISIIPGIKTSQGIKFLSVTDRIKLTETGAQTENFVCGNGILESGESCDDGNKINGDGCSLSCKLEGVLGISQCSDCGVICSIEKCHTIKEEGNLGCYFEGGFTKKCSSCLLLTCDKYKNKEDCRDNRCNVPKCIWNNNKCIENPDCGDDYVNSALGEECDPPQTACTASYGSNCTYCGNSCYYMNIFGGYCGDEAINGNEQCDSGDLNTDTPCIPTYGGSCSYCNTSCQLKSIQGASCGDGICNAIIGETCSSCISDCGVCCGDGICNATIEENCSSCTSDCGTCQPTLKLLGATCALGSECQSGYCYIDADDDRYIPASGTKTCESSPSTSSIVDCDDNNPNIQKLLNCYVDNDNDNYGGDLLSSECVFSEAQCSSGISTSGDCYDYNAVANPGVHWTNYFLIDRGDGSFDYDCSGGEELECSPNGLTTMPLTSCTSTNPALITSGKFAGFVGSVPACGQSGTFRYCIGYNELGCSGYSQGVDQCGGYVCPGSASLISWKIVDGTKVSKCH